MEPQSGVIRDVNVRRTVVGQIATVWLGGDVDLHHSPSVRTELIKLAGGKPARLVIDLSSVDYMDSSGVATLVQALQQVKRYNGQLILVAPSERVRSIFQIAKLDAIFQIVNTQEEAARQ